MEEVAPESPRYAVLAAALQFKSSWVRLGEVLYRVQESQLFRDWGFNNFENYCKDEIRITRETAAKLCRSYGFIAETQPELVRAAEPGVEPPQVPDYRAVDLLARMRDNERVPESIYRDLTKATFAEDLGVNDLRKRLREEVPEAFTRRSQRAPAPHRVLQSAMSHCARLIETLAQLEDGDDTVLEQAEALRDMIAGKLKTSQN